MRCDQPLRLAGGDRQPPGRAAEGGRGAPAGRAGPTGRGTRLPHSADHPSRPCRPAARDALGGERYLVAVGGDGTVHEVVDGMISGGQPIAPDAVLGVVTARWGATSCGRSVSPATPAGRPAAGRGPRPRHRRGHGDLRRRRRHPDQVLRRRRRGRPGRRGGGPGGRAQGVRPVPRRRPVRRWLLADAAGLPARRRCGSTRTVRPSAGGRSTWWSRTAGSTAAACRSRRSPTPATACSTCS